MWTIAENAETICLAQQRLRTQLWQAMPDKITCTVSGAGNRYTDTIAYSPVAGVWYYYQLQEKKHFNGFGVGLPTPGGKVALQCEINLPLAGVSKSMAAAFAVNEQGQTALIHRGKIRSGKAAFFRYYHQGKTVEIDGEVCALVALLDSGECPRQVWDFVKTVLAIKEKIKQER